MPLDGAAVYVGGAGPFRFLVDTGSTMTVISRAVAERSGVRPIRAIQAVSTTGVLDLTKAEADVRAAGLSVAATDVLIGDLPRFSSHGRVDGILGMNFFAGHSMRIDVQNRCVEIDAAAPAGVSLDSHEVAGRVAIEADGLNLVIDSAATFAVLTSSRARGHAMIGSDADVTSAAGTRRERLAMIPRLRFGNLIQRDVAAVISPRNDPREDGLLPVTLFETLFIAADRTHVIVR